WTSRQRSRSDAGAPCPPPCPRARLLARTLPSHAHEHDLHVPLRACVTVSTSSTPATDPVRVPTPTAPRCSRCSQRLPLVSVPLGSGERTDPESPTALPPRPGGSRVPLG
ncbi:unnamed protein product, partial [Ixodes pacificus]